MQLQIILKFRVILSYFGTFAKQYNWFVLPASAFGYHHSILWNESHWNKRWMNQRQKVSMSNYQENSNAKGSVQ